MKQTTEKSVLGGDGWGEVQVLVIKQIDAQIDAKFTTCSMENGLNRTLGQNFGREITVITTKLLTTDWDKVVSNDVKGINKEIKLNSMTQNKILTQINKTKLSKWLKNKWLIQSLTSKVWRSDFGEPSKFLPKYFPKFTITRRGWPWLLTAEHTK